MTTIAVTGIDGFLGWHLRVYYHASQEVKLVGIDRSVCRDAGRFREIVREADVVVHLAGMNRGDDREIETVNVDLTSQLIAACREAEAHPQIVLANSTHCERDTAYGRSKRRSAELLAAWAKDTGSVFTDFVIPNVYGEGGRPFYNSVVSTFCHQLASGEEPSIIQDGRLELIHAQAVAEEAASAIKRGAGGEIRLAGSAMSVSDLLRKLQGFDRSYRGHLIPQFPQDMDLDLFNTYRSYLYPKHYPVTLQVHGDARGQLFEAVKSIHGGQCFISTTKPGITRGDHYHTRKVERFLVLNGEAVIRIRKLFTGDTVEFKVTGSVPQYIDMPTFCTHSITNTGSGDLTTLFWAHEIYDPQRSDTIREPV
ncbi:MAG: capsule biosynthesis protein CapF [Nitrospira sp. SG-bin2]|uniref:polysaccharide biosynthesis C-terminal domain-containing protein n=1 Tax=Nitrospira cf. moscoviensis SBR1015 TaxID=96242 RepID=UPI000A0BE2EF|nr:NAD-dependent epimerase/dehydratase family protein [Nitrospira cf. moscoviensis SBR1015]OQW32068.1 MAG: capsule biosynthesis protein CapF [Nitrospira sp. SG-bin2]